MDLSSRAKLVREQAVKMIEKADIKQLKKDYERLKNESADSNLWKDADHAQSVMKNLSQVEQELELWQRIDNETQEVIELVDLNDDSLETDLDKQLAALENNLEKVRRDLAFDGEYDDGDAIVGIYAGAGGTDAQDWASMLLRMYTRWAESAGYKVSIDQETAGEEAGIKSVQFTITGRYAYGKMQGEHGVHRLVRLSPFNANNLRQTSFAKVEVLPKIEQPDKVPLDDQEVKIDVFRAGGHGGQSVNTTDSAVRVTHLPTGIVVTIQNERSQIQNKETALSILRSKLAALQLQQHAENIKDIKGPNQSAEWGNQIRSYVLHPYNMVKDLRTQYETSDTQSVLDGDLDDFIDAYLHGK